jgi:hypothetical protein
MQTINLSRQWAVRADDERFTSLGEMLARAIYLRDVSKLDLIRTGDLHFCAEENVREGGLHVSHN